MRPASECHDGYGQKDIFQRGCGVVGDQVFGERDERGEVRVGADGRRGAGAIALGGAVGLYIKLPGPPQIYGSLVEFLFALLFAIVVLSIGLSYWIENSWVGRGLTALRDDEEASEAMGVPTFRLKMMATVLSGFIMGMVGSLYPLYIGYMEPYSVFDLGISFNVFVMTFIGGIGTWQGPVIGAIILGTIQQASSVTVTSEYNLAVVAGAMLFFGIFAPGGLKKVISSRMSRRSPDEVA